MKIQWMNCYHDKVPINKILNEKKGKINTISTNCKYNVI